MNGCTKTIYFVDSRISNAAQGYAQEHGMSLSSFISTLVEEFLKLEVRKGNAVVETLLKENTKEVIC